MVQANLSLCQAVVIKRCDLCFVISGRIVHLGQHYCFIDGNLAFARQCCTGSYVPCKGDVVAGNMIECDQGQRWTHRALTVGLHSPAVVRSSSSVRQAPVSSGGAGDSNTNKSRHVAPVLVST